MCVDRQTLYHFTVTDIRQTMKTKKRPSYIKARCMDIAASEGHWRDPAWPIVETTHKDSLCDFKGVWIYTWIAKPFIVLPLQIFGNNKMKPITWPWFIKASTEIRRI